MHFLKLQCRNLRNLGDVCVEFSSHINVFVGDNGAGKTSILEAAFLLSRGRSFRPGTKDALLQRGAREFTVFAELQYYPGTCHRLGIQREQGDWRCRFDGETITLSEVVRRCAVVCFEPGSHALIAGPAEERRHYLDWGVFHVEQDFLTIWRRYQRALKQRNYLLRQGRQDDENCLAWEIELNQAADLIDQMRQEYLKFLLPHLAQLLAKFLPELGAFELCYKRGWQESTSLLEVLAQQRLRDLARGHTNQGCHRADWNLSFEYAPQREHLSRGQEKLLALACLLAQASHYAEAHQEWPILCLDDFASELDLAHQEAVLDWAQQGNAQWLITGTERLRSLQTGSACMFHVEQGWARRVL